MNKRDPQSELQDYLSDLLLEPEVAPHQAVEPVPQPCPLPSTQTDPVPLPVYAEPAVELSVLEQSKREKLQALLSSKPLAETPVAQPAVSTEVAEVAAPPETVVETEEEIPADVTELEVVEQIQLDQEHSQTDEVAAVSHYLAWNDNGRPEWAQNRFDALLFDVAGLTLAVPLIALGQIYPLTDELTPLFGQADWFMGLLPTPNGKIRTVNTALFVMPERYEAAFLDAAKYVVSIDGVPWGLAVDSINQPISLDPNDVKWRSERSKRPWLAGTVKSAMCALIDIPQMGRMLTNADKNHTTR